MGIQGIQALEKEGGARYTVWYQYFQEEKTLSKYFVGFWNVSVILTYISLLCAVGGICMCAEGNIWAAVILLVCCGVCDMYDGKIARATKRSEDAKVFGIQIDSLCDLIAFGVLPSCIGHACGVRGLGMAVLMFYTLAALIRLGYFNVTEQKRQQESSENRKFFEGLPVTWSAVIIPLTSLCRLFMGAEFKWVIGVVLGVVGFCFIARIKVPKPQI